MIPEDFDELIALEKVNMYIKADNGRRGQGLKDKLVDLANSYDKMQLWTTALYVHQKIDELYPEDMANKIAIVNYLPHTRTVKNAYYLMQSIAHSYTAIIKQLSQKTGPDNCLESYKLTMDMMGNMAFLLMNNQTEAFPLFTNASNNKKWHDLVIYTDIAFEDIKQCFAVGDAVLEAFPGNNELEGYVYHIWEYFYPLYKLICEAKTDNKGEKYWHTKPNVAVLEDKDRAIKEYNKHVNGTLGERIAAFFKARFTGKQIPANETPWQKYYREKSERDYKQLQTCRRSFQSWMILLKDMLKNMSAAHDHEDAKWNLYYINTSRDVVGFILYDKDDPRCIFASDWDLINNPLYYWLSGNVYCKAPRKAQKNVVATQAQPIAKKAFANKETRTVAAATTAASYTAYQNYATKPQEETLYYTYTVNNSANNNFDDDEEWERTRINHDQLEDERGYMINGKWQAEHERNMSNPGSPIDINGYAKSPAYEEAIRDNFYLEEEEGYHGYDNPYDYAEDADSSYNDANDDFEDE